VWPSSALQHAHGTSSTEGGNVTTQRSSGSGGGTRPPPSPIRPQRITTASPAQAAAWQKNSFDANAWRPSGVAARDARGTRRGDPRLESYHLSRSRSSLAPAIADEGVILTLSGPVRERQHAFPLPYGQRGPYSAKEGSERRACGPRWGTQSTLFNVVREGRQGTQQTCVFD
jgi:hypothetical protein